MLLFYLSLIESQDKKSKFEKLYYEYKALMKHIALDILRDEGYSEDAVHEAFIKLTRYLKGIDEIKSHKTKSFIVIIIRSVSLDMLEKEKRNKIYHLEDADEVADNAENIFENIEVKELVSLLGKLPEIHRDIIELKVYYGLSDKKIADILGISHQAARKRLQRARNAFVKLLKDWSEC